jgi:hypothetical protein
MKTFFFVLFSIASLFITRTASAWDAPELWYDPAQGVKASPYDVSPGGGGIIGTGGQTDYGITCASCHTSTGVQNPGTISVDFAPAWNGQYVPGQTYAITATLKGEHLGVSGCDANMDNRNQIAVTFEDDLGKVAGVLAGDYGSSASCPSTPPPQGFTGSTILWKDCHAIIANTLKNTTSWTFKWTAPAQGAGTVTMYYGAVDGDCSMSSMGDDVKTGSVKLNEKTARNDLPPSRSMYAMLAFIPVIAGVFSRRRRKR